MPHSTLIINIDKTYSLSLFMGLFNGEDTHKPRAGGTRQVCTDLDRNKWKHFCWHQLESSLQCLRTLDNTLGHPSTPAEVFQRICLGVGESSKNCLIKVLVFFGNYKHLLF